MALHLGQTNDKLSHNECLKTINDGGIILHPTEGNEYGDLSFFPTNE